jgi:hypothetical protein
MKQKRRYQSKWSNLYEAIEQIVIGASRKFTIGNITETHFRIIVCRIAKRMDCNLSVHKVGAGTYQIGKFEKE